MIPGFERAKTAHALDRAATMIGLCLISRCKIEHYGQNLKIYIKHLVWETDGAGNIFFTQTEQRVRIHNKCNEDQANITKVKLCGEALQFVQGREDLPSGQVAYQTFNEALLVEWFPEKFPAGYYYSTFCSQAWGGQISTTVFLYIFRSLSAKTI
jgi:hypothetical protein